MYAQVTIPGRVTHDVELRTNSTTGEPSMRVNLAVNEGYGEHQHTSYYQCWLEGNEATRASKANVRKGSFLLISGQLSIADITRKDGTNDKVARVTKARWDFIPGSKRTETAASSNDPAETKPAQAGFEEFPVQDLDSDDIPF